jgi:hypothetical protein
VLSLQLQQKVTHGAVTSAEELLQEMRSLCDAFQVECMAHDSENDGDHGAAPLP